VQYKAADTNAGDGQIKPHFNILNTGTTSVPMSELTIRYWFTREGSTAMQFNCDYAVKGCGNVTGALTAITAVTGANYYLQLSFGSGAGSIAANGSSGEIQARFNKTDWTNFNEADDYSFDATKTAFADWSRVTLYRNGQLVWGTEPTGGTPPPTTPPPSTTPPPGDQPPSVPGNLTSPSKTATSITLAWTASTDDGGVTGYRVYRGITLVGSPLTTAFTDTGLTANTAYSYVVAAVDTAGQLSATTPVLTVTTSATSTVFRVNAQGRITKNGVVFPIHGGSWFGLQGRYEPAGDPVNPRGAPMEMYIGNTFWANGGSGTGRTIQQTMTEIKALGINVIRLPVVHQTLNPNDPQGRDPFLKNFSTVRVANSRLALEQFIIAADQNDIQILLDIHSCSNYVDWRKGRLDARPPYVDATRDNYDYTREDSSCAATNNPATVTRIQAYNETIWLQDLRTLAGLDQQLGVDNIIGIDIYNEPWDYSWQEWKTLSEHAYTAINAVNPNILIFVQGISGSSGNQDGTPATVTQTPHGNLATVPNWGENLYEAGTNPPAIPKDRLVFSPHAYGPSVFVGKQFMDPAQPQCAGLEGDAAGDAKCNIVINATQLRAGWEEHFGYLKGLGYAVIVGEFGGNMDWPLGQASLRDQNRFSYLTDKTVDNKWQQAFVDYMSSKGIEGIYWSINPESGDTGGIYGHAYDPISNTGGWGEWRPFDTRKVDLLKRLWAAIP
jgi:endoglucanase